MKAPNLLDELSTWSHWHRDSNAALVSLPELSSIGFGLESWPIGQQGATLVLPVTGISRLAGSVLETMEKGRLDGADAFLRASPEVVASDVMVAQLGTLLPCVPDAALSRLVLGIIALSTSLLSREATRALELEPTLARRSLAMSEAVWSLSDSEKADALARISDALSARVSAAFGLHNRPADGLCRRLIANRLVWVVGHKDLRDDIGLAAAVVGLPIDRSVVQTIRALAQAAISAGHSRLGSRKERPADAQMERVLAGTKGEALMDGYAGESLVRLLPHLVEPRGLKGQVTDHKQASRFLEPAAVRTVAGAWRELIAVLRPWDLVSALCGRIQLVARTSTGWRLERNPLDDSERWSLSIPRDDPRQTFTVVAVRFAELLHGGGMDARKVDRQRWNDMLGSNRIGPWLGDHGVVAFIRSADAVRFALEVNSNFLSADGFLGDGESRIAVVPGTRVPVGVAEGIIVGGIDGETVALDGPAVSTAIHLTGMGPVHQTAYDPMRIRRVCSGLYGLESGGVALSRSVATASWNNWGGSVHRYGDGSMVAGTSKDFKCYPVDGWAAHAGGAVVFVSVGKARGAPILEAIAMGEHGFKDLMVRDEQLQTGGEGVLTVAPSKDGEALDKGIEDPFGFNTNETEESKNSKMDDAWDGIGFGDDDD